MTPGDRPRYSSWKLMIAAANRVQKPRLVLALTRALLVTILATLLSFAVSLLVAIVGVTIYARVRGLAPDMPFAYRNIAAPFALVVGAIVLVLSLSMEVRHYRQAKALASIERAG